MDDTDLVRALDPLLGVGGLPADWEEETLIREQRINEFYQLGFATIWDAHLDRRPSNQIGELADRMRWKLVNGLLVAR